MDTAFRNAALTPVQSSPYLICRIFVNQDKREYADEWIKKAQVHIQSVQSYIDFLIYLKLQQGEPTSSSKISIS